MKELTVHDIEATIRRDESRILEVKKTTGEIIAGMQSGCAFLNTEGGWLFFGECKAAGLPTPVFETVPNFVCLTIRFKNPLRPYITGESNGALNGELNGELNEALKGLGAPVIATYNIIKQTPGIQRKDIITHTKKGSSTIDRHLALLTEKNLIEHRYSKKTGGYYAIL